jgi:hypothetical protein
MQIIILRAGLTRNLGVWTRLRWNIAPPSGGRVDGDSIFPEQWCRRARREVFAEDWGATNVAFPKQPPSAKSSSSSSAKMNTTTRFIIVSETGYVFLF